MAIVRTTLIMSAAIAAPTMLLQQPLKSGPGGQEPNYAVRRLSPMAVAGHALYRQHCVACHGLEAVGSEKAPSLAIGGGPAAKFDKMTFHLAVREGRPGRGHGTGPMPAFDLSFNQIELIGRYVREVAGPSR